jgi:hypothetical protein
MVRHQNTGKYGWRPLEWARAVGVSRAYVYLLLNDDLIESVKLGSARVITTSPSEFLDAQREDAA